MDDGCLRVDTSLIEDMARNIPGQKDITRIAAIFQALQSETRLKLMYLLCQKEMCVCELECALDVTQSAISHSLRLLRQLDLVRVRKEGKFSVYYIADDHVRRLLELSRRHVMECEQ